MDIHFTGTDKKDEEVYVVVATHALQTRRAKTYHPRFIWNGMQVVVLLLGDSKVMTGGSCALRSRTTVHGFHET